MRDSGQQTDINEKPLDGTKGGLLDSTENLDAGNSQDTHSTTDNAQNAFDPARVMEDVNSNKKLGKLINTAFQKMKDLEEKRAAINDDLKSIRQGIVAGQGLPLAAVKMAYKLHCMDLDKVQEVLIGVAVVAKATKLPIQIDFLDTTTVTNIH